GTYVALATPDGRFGNAFLALAGFGFSEAGGGWFTQDQYPREVADINGDGRADIVGFGSAGVFYALGQANGTFGPVVADIPSFGAAVPAGGWTSQDTYPRLLGDVTGEHLADILGFGNLGVFVSQAGVAQAPPVMPPLPVDFDIHI